MEQFDDHFSFLFSVTSWENNLDMGKKFRGSVSITNSNKENSRRRRSPKSKWKLRSCFDKVLHIPKEIASDVFFPFAYTHCKPLSDHHGDDEALGCTWGLTPLVTHWLYTRAVRPILVYDSLVRWLKTQQSTAAKSLSKIQRAACLGALGAMK